VLLLHFFVFFLLFVFFVWPEERTSSTHHWMDGWKNGWMINDWETVFSSLASNS
jgi:succinate dehydrogenase hydrophobic anchor subunit